MINIIKQEIPIDESLKKKLEFICDFCNTTPTFINGSIRKIQKTNINYIEPNKIIIKGTTFLAFNHGRDVYVEVVSDMYNHQIISEKTFDRITGWNNDLARYADEDDPRYPIQNWMRNKDVISYLGLWESIHNENFKGVEFDTFKNEAGSNKFKISPQKWIRETNAIGMISKSGNNGGTYARSDIALEFASWLSPEFKLYVIQEFQRLKKNEAYQNKIDWHANRVLAKVSYVVHTDAIKSIIVPTLTEKQKKFVYAEEADVLNVALFGMTAKEWRESNPNLAEDGNIRDYTDLLHLVILSNLENINAELIEMGIPQSERLIRLNDMAKKQMELLRKNKSLKNLEYIENKVNDKLLIETK